ncbi:hypothetical protein ACP3VS_18465 [Lysinibacillus sp. VIII_CA]|uniref:hypothetical protein n=1 Tax=Lysinibacillus sp. VIII_CA TaxID=3417452 RepID=UPI003CE68FED
MTKRNLFDLYEGDRIKVFSAGKYEGEGIFIRILGERHEDFLHWIKNNGNKCYTSLDAINIEKIGYYCRCKKRDCDCDDDHVRDCDQ